MTKKKYISIDTSNYMHIVVPQGWLLVTVQQVKNIQTLKIGFV